MIEDRDRLLDLLREMRGNIPQRQFAKRIGVSYAAVRSWEQGESYPVLKNLHKIAFASGMSIDQLLAYLKGDVGLGDISPEVRVAEDLLPSLKALSHKELARLVQIIGAILEGKSEAINEETEGEEHDASES